MYFLFLFALIAAVSANCPAVKPVDNFQFASFGQGVWYEVARYPNSIEEGTICGRSEFNVEGDQVKVKNYYVNANKVKSIEGVVSIAHSAEQSGQILYSLPNGPNGPIESFVNILDIDYNNYVIEYFCIFDEVSQKIKEFAWIFSRSKVLPDDAKVAVEKHLKESEVLDSKRFEWLNFSDEDCKIIA